MSKNLFDVFSKPGFLFPALILVNFLNCCDRAIIPATVNEFLDFICSNLSIKRPEIYLGVLQSSFIVGFMIASFFFSSLIQRKSPFFILAVGVLCWMLATISAGISLYSNSFYLLLISRMVSGVGEASFTCTAPPWITTYAPLGSSGTWLAIYYTAIPFGTAFGYTSASYITIKYGVYWIFLMEATIMFPLFVLFWMASSNYKPTMVVENEKQKLLENNESISFHEIANNSHSIQSPKLCKNNMLHDGHSYRNDLKNVTKNLFPSPSPIGYVQLLAPDQRRFIFSDSESDTDSKSHSQEQKRTYSLNKLNDLPVPIAPLQQSLPSTNQLSWIQQLYIIWGCPIYLCMTLG